MQYYKTYKKEHYLCIYCREAGGEQVGFSVLLMDTTNGDGPGTTHPHELYSRH